MHDSDFAAVTVTARVQRTSCSRRTFTITALIWSGEKALHDQRNDDTGPKKRQHSQKRGEFLGVPTPHKTCFGLLLFVARNVCFDSNGLRTTGLIQQPTNDCKMIVKILLTR